MSNKLILKELSRYNIGTYADIIYRNALLYPDKEAFVFGSERITFAQFNARVNSLIHALHSMGVKKGDVLGVLSLNCLEYYDVYGAAEKGGFIISPFNARLNADALEYLINYSEANTLFVGPELLEMTDLLKPRLPNIKNFILLRGTAPNMKSHHELLASYPKEEPDVQVDEDDPVHIIYTSGTTGLPRGALYTQRRAMDDTKTLTIESALEPSDRFLIIAPAFHVSGIDYPLCHFYVGGTSVILESFDPATALQAIQDERITTIVIVPTHLIAMLNLPDVGKYDISSLKRVCYVGSSMPVEIIKKALELWGPIFLQDYGLTESGPDTAVLKREEHMVIDRPPEEQEVLYSCGRPFIGVHVRIVDENVNDVEPGEVGEIIIQSKHIMVECWRKPEETQKRLVNDWLHTGDLGTYDERGYIYIVDRKDDMIISGGENIYPREVEEVLYKHPAILEAAVIGIPDPYWVEKVHAAIVLKQGASLTKDELISFCKKNLASYKTPKSVEFVDSLPKTSFQKISRTELRKKYRSA